ncbi:hypothetical protein Dvina_20495 [Dactylosporangium vinaceum]|uniref:Uncharacterized protein n=1 Tax=Dactylosporangium vinaceum TaxID=53362 RepID=A0ABV5MS82_9ACTN|nr:hypothetical protein [Dactylosporangium vinaceum]UAC00227.1 hypothetical protein Dvina_20495 [Dactylosporangium vinaceum]
MRWKSQQQQQQHPRQRQWPSQEAAQQAVLQLTEAVKALVSAIAPPGGDRVLTYERAIGWFVEHRPPIPVSGGAILRSPAPDGRTEILQVFLTEHQQVAVDGKGVPYGRRFVVDRLDEELTESFDNTALLIVN